MSYSPGSGSQGAISTSSDVALNNLTINDALVYTADGKWENVAGAVLAPTTVKMGTYNATSGQLVPADATGAGFTITLPTAPPDKTKVVVQKVDSSANVVTVASAGSDVFNATGGPTNLSVALQNQSVTLQYANASHVWYVNWSTPGSSSSGANLLGSAENPQTNPAAARNSNLVVNWWAVPTGSTITNLGTSGFTDVVLYT